MWPGVKVARSKPVNRSSITLWERCWSTSGLYGPRCYTGQYCWRSGSPPRGPDPVCAGALTLNLFASIRDGRPTPLLRRRVGALRERSVAYGVDRSPELIHDLVGRPTGAEDAVDGVLTGHSGQDQSGTVGVGGQLKLVAGLG